MIAIIMLSGSVNLVKISDSQAGGILNWNLFGHGKLPWLLLPASSGVIEVSLQSLSVFVLLYLLFSLQLLQLK